MIKIDSTNFISFYGAIVATISLLWNIIAFILKNKKNLLVKTSVQLNTPIEEKQDYFKTLSIEIVNNGKVDVNISSVSLSFCGKKIYVDGLMFDELTKVDIRGIKRYPLVLKTGESFSDSMNIDDIIGYANSSLNDKDRLCIIVKDTLGKVYKSNKLVYKNLKG